MRLRNVKNKAEIMNDSNYLVKDNFAWKGKWKKLFKYKIKPKSEDNFTRTGYKL